MLIAAPAIVIRLLLGVEASSTELVLGRCFGVALLALGTACRPRDSSRRPTTEEIWQYLEP